MGIGPDVRVRLTAEGEAQVVNALRKVTREATTAGRSASRGFGQFNAALSGARTLLAQVAAAASIGAFVSLAKNAANVADELGKVSQKVGASVQNMSALRAAASTADVSMETLTRTLAIFNKQTTALEAGSKDAAKAFSALGISAQQLQGLDAAERLGLVAEAFGKLKDSPAKTALAFQVFGRQAAALIPLLNDLSEGGLKGAIDRAREFGLLLSEDTARAAQAINDDFTIIKEQVLAGAARFVEGLAPGVHAALAEIQGDLGENQDVWKTWGEAVGGFIATAALAIEGTVDRIGTSLQKLGNAARIAGSFLAAIFNPAQAAKATADAIAFTEINKQLEAEFQKRQGGRLSRAESIGAALSKGTAGLPSLKGGAQDEDAPIVQQGKSAVELEKERLEAVRRLEAERERLIDKQLQAEGRRHELALRNIEEETAKLDAVLGELEGKGVPQPDRAAQVAQFRAALESAEAFRVQSEQAEGAFDALARDRATIEEQVAAGLLSQLTGAERLLAIDRERLPILRAQAEALLAAARATGDPESIAQAQEYADSVGKIGANVEASTDLLGRLGAVAEDSLAGALTNLFTTGIREARNFGEALRGIGFAVVDAIQQMLAAELAAQALKSLRSLFFKGGGLVGGDSAVEAADGGLILGPGTATSDSVPAWLSNGEYVVRAAAVQQPGVLSALESINRGSASPALNEFRGARRFADGGLVEGAGASHLSSSLTIGLEPGLVVSQLSTPEGERAVVRVLSKNRRAAGSVLGG